MNAEAKIRQALKTIYNDGDVNAARIWKGWDMGTNTSGWHYQMFGKNARWIGDNLTDALATIQDILTENRELA